MIDIKEKNDFKAKEFFYLRDIFLCTNFPFLAYCVTAYHIPPKKRDFKHCKTSDKANNIFPYTIFIVTFFYSNSSLYMQTNYKRQSKNLF